MEDLTPVASSSVSAIGYDPVHSVLSVRLHPEGRTYQYRMVPKSVYELFLAADSKGRFFNTVVRDRYPWTRIA